MQSSTSISIDQVQNIQTSEYSEFYKWAISTLKPVQVDGFPCFLLATENTVPNEENPAEFLFTLTRVKPGMEAIRFSINPQLDRYYDDAPRPVAGTPLDLDFDETIHHPLITGYCFCEIMSRTGEAESHFNHIEILYEGRTAAEAAEDYASGFWGEDNLDDEDEFNAGEYCFGGNEHAVSVSRYFEISKEEFDIMYNILHVRQH